MRRRSQGRAPGPHPFVLALAPVILTAPIMRAGPIGVPAVIAATLAAAAPLGPGRSSTRSCAQAVS